MQMNQFEMTVDSECADKTDAVGSFFLASVESRMLHNSKTPIEFTL